MTKTLTNTTETRRLVEDLLEKYPRGPSRRQERKLYVSHQVWSEHYNCYKPAVILREDTVGRLGITELTVKHWGYEPMALFKLGVRNEDAAGELVRSLYPAVRGAALTRRKRLLWSRLKGAVAHVMREGAEGIWNVSSHSAPYGSIWRSMLIWGTNKADVEAQVRLIGPMTGLKPEWSLRIQFHDLGTPEDATQHAVAAVNIKVNRIKADIKNYRDRLAQLEKELEEEMSRAAQSMGGIMLLSGTEEDDEQEAAQ